jgi:hypothetical protein
MDVYGVDRESNWPGTQVRGRPLSSSAILHRAVTIDEVHRARAIGRVGSCVAIAIDHSSPSGLADATSCLHCSDGKGIPSSPAFSLCTS